VILLKDLIQSNSGQKIGADDSGQTESGQRISTL